jgi:hypothetical protein
LGLKNLKKIINNQDVKIFNKIKGEDQVIFPCQKKEEWILSLPVHDLFFKETKIQKQQLYFLGV